MGCHTGVVWFIDGTKQHNENSSFKRPYHLSLITKVSGMNNAHRNKSNPLFENKVKKYLNEVNKWKNIIQ